MKSSQHKRKVFIIISGIDFSYGIKWTSQFLDPDKFEQIYLFLNDKVPILYKQFTAQGMKCYFITYNSKKNIPITFLKLLFLLWKEKPYIVHTHLFDASLIGLIAAKILRIKKRIYTRHHSTYHHEYFKNFVKYDHLINTAATHIIAISKNVELVLMEMENVPDSKITIINHGFLMNSFQHPNVDYMTKIGMSAKLSGHYPIIGVISRYTYWKGVQFTIMAFQNVLKKYPKAKLVLANAQGDYSSEIKDLLGLLPPNSFVEIPFERDVFALYALFDIFVHVPVNQEVEAFGQTYVEALASKIPSIFTLSGISREFIIDDINALVVPFKDAKSIESAIYRLIENEVLKEEIVNQGFKDVNALFDLSIMKFALEKLYNE